MKVDATVKDGEVVKVGPIALTSHLTPGHTKGTTTWTMTVKDSAGQERTVVFLGSTTVNPGTKLVNNAKYPAIEADYKHAFEVEKALPCEVFLAAHASAFGGPAEVRSNGRGQRRRGVHRPRGVPRRDRPIREGVSGGVGEAARRRQQVERRPPRPSELQSHRLRLDGRRAVRGTPISSSDALVVRASPDSTFTRRSRKTFVSKNASRSCRASVPIRLIISPPRPITIGFCDSVSTRSCSTAAGSAPARSRRTDRRPPPSRTAARRACAAAPSRERSPPRARARADR